MNRLDKNFIPPPQPPLDRLIRDGNGGTCPKCGSSEIRKYLIGQIIGCINKKCNNFYKNEQIR